MTKRAYAEIPADETTEIDVTHIAGSRLNAADAALLRKYQDTLYKATYWPCVDHFRDCVAAYDAMVDKPEARS